MSMNPFSSIETVIESLSSHQYIANRSLATVLYLSFHLNKPIFLEGEPGVGKTGLAHMLSEMLDTRLIRLQCYEGLDASTALYEWNYPKQLLRIRMEEQSGKSPDEIGNMIYTEPYLIRRPLLDAIWSPSSGADGKDSKPPVLLIDELDQADEEFEAFLLEVLSEFQISIPEIGTIKAKHIPMVVITSNRTRDIHDAVKRRCLYHWIDYPDFEKELAIIRKRLPGIESALARQIAGFMKAIRTENLMKKPGISETLDWAEALIKFNKNILDKEIIEQTLGCILKYREDIETFTTMMCSDPQKIQLFITS